MRLVVGKLGDPGITDPLRRVTFRPRERATFFVAGTDEEVHNADAVTFDGDGNAWI